jgi:hypothetical protein
MAEKTLQEALGTNAAQDATTITLNKPDLGLTGTTCTADQVVAAIAIKAKPVLTQAAFDSEVEQRVYLTDGFSSFVTKNEASFVVRQVTINLAEPDTGATLNPNNY